MHCVNVRAVAAQGDLREMTRGLCTPTEAPRPEPTDELLAARRSDNRARVLRVALRNVPLAAATLLLTGTAGKICGAVAGGLGMGGGIGVMAGLLVGMPLLSIGARRHNNPLMITGLALGVAGGLAGMVGSAYLGWTYGGNGLGVASGLLAVSALSMGVTKQSQKRKELEQQHENALSQWEAATTGKEPPEELALPSSIREIGDMISVGGIRLPRKTRANPAP